MIADKNLEKWKEDVGGGSSQENQSKESCDSSVKDRQPDASHTFLQIHIDRSRPCFLSLEKTWALSTRLPEATMYACPMCTE